MKKLLTKWTLNPVARKRLQRFRAHRRAFVSFWLLIALFLVSLSAELICNDRPLYLRFEGKSYFPAFRFYPDDLFTGSGQKTRADYRTLNEKPQFGADSKNFMLFAPVRYGPLESVSPDSLRNQEWMEVKAAPLQHVGFVEIDPQYRLVRQRAADFFLSGQQVAGKDMDLRALWALPESFQDAVRARFANAASTRQEVALAGGHDSEIRATWVLSPFSPRVNPPATVRITLREVLDEAVAHEWRLDTEGNLVGGESEAWQRQAPEVREAILGSLPDATVRSRMEKVVEGPQGALRVRFRKNEVAWPYPPCRGHWMGIDSAGRDVFARVLYGLRISLRFGFMLVSMSMVLGVLVGALQGYYGGKVDITTQRLIEVWSALPFLYVMILIGSVYGRSFTLLLFCYAIFNWIGISYYMRAEFLRLRHLPFVDAARCMGIRTPRIILHHILPNALTPIVTFFPFSLVGAIGSLAALDYLGFGLPPPTPSWGELLHQAQQYRWAWWLILYPSLALFVVMLLGVFIGEGVRDAYDPKPRSKLS